MSTVNLSEAHRALLDIAGRGKQYRQDQVFQPAEGEGTRATIVGNGFDLERNVTVQLDGTAVETTVQLRVLAMRDGTLFIRTWLNWTSRFGKHRSFVNYNLSPAAIVQLGSAINDDDVDTEITNMEQAVGAIFDQLEKQDSLGADWQQQYPSLMEVEKEFTDAEAEHHSKLVLAARETEPKLLNMLSDTELGGVDAQEIIDLHDWLIQQPEVRALA